MIGLGRHSLFGMAVLAASGVPYALSHVANDTDTETSSASSDPLLEAQHRPAPDMGGWSGRDLSIVDPSIADLAQPSAQPLEGPQVTDLGEVLRFDVSPTWLIQRWPRVMNSRHDGGLLAYRVLLVTGARKSDLAGPLTYFFDSAQRLERIGFQGTTGDCRPLVQHLTSRYGMALQRTSNPAEQVYETRHDGQVVSRLRIVTAALLDAAMPTTRYRIELTLSRPSDHRWFSEAKPALEGIRWP